MLLQGLDGIKAQQEAALNLELTPDKCVVLVLKIFGHSKCLLLLSLAWLELDAINTRRQAAQSGDSVMEKLDAVYLRSMFVFVAAERMTARGGTEGEGCQVLFRNPAVVVEK